MTLIEPALHDAVTGAASVPSTTFAAQAIGLVLVDFPQPTCPVAVPPPAS